MTRDIDTQAGISIIEARAVDWRRSLLEALPGRGERMTRQ